MPGTGDKYLQTLLKTMTLGADEWMRIQRVREGQIKDLMEQASRLFRRMTTRTAGVLEENEFRDAMGTGDTKVSRPDHLIIRVMDYVLGFAFSSPLTDVRFLRRFMKEFQRICRDRS